MSGRPLALLSDVYPHPGLLDELTEGVQGVLGDLFIGMYLDGSLATGGFDADSNVDFVVVTDEEVSGRTFSLLQALHDDVATHDSSWAMNLEGAYISRRALCCYDPAHTQHPNIERGRGECLKMVQHDEAWIVHRWVLREQGITLVGLDSHTLIDPVSADGLRRAMAATLRGWATSILEHPDEISSVGYQTFSVLTLCRILYTLHSGTVVSKPFAAHLLRYSRLDQF